MNIIKILGIDPGTHRIGYGMVFKDKNAFSAGEYGTIEFQAGKNEERLVILERELRKLIRRNKPTVIAVEKLYFSKNQKTALAVAESRGVIMFASKKSGTPILEYDPTTVKQRVTGYGHSDKRSVLKMVKILLKIDDFSGLDDASDALAIGLTAALEHKPLGY